MQDQNGTVHEYDRDDLGRVELDKVPAFGTDIDDSVKSIGTTFDGAGRVTFVTSSAAAHRLHIFLEGE